MAFLDRLFRRSKGKGNIRTDSKGEQSQSSEGKRCAVCGEKVDKGLIQCPKCGSGTFTPPKKRPSQEPEIIFKYRGAPKRSSRANLICPKCGTEYHNKVLADMNFSATINKYRKEFGAHDPTLTRWIGSGKFGKCPKCGVNLEPI